MDALQSAKELEEEKKRAKEQQAKMVLQNNLLMIQCPRVAKDFESY